MKKILALVVAFALVFTCISGCFTTAAEEAAATPSISVVGVEVEASATEAGVVVKGENFDDLAAQNLVIDFDDNLTVTVPETWAEVGTAGDVVYTVDTETNTYKLISWNATEAGGVSEFTFTFDVSFLANETELEVVYNVDLVSVDAGSYDAEASIKDIALNDGTVTQKANKPEHVHVWDEGVVTTRPTTTETGVRTYTCECTETKTEVIPVAVVKNSADHGDTYKLGHNLALDSSIKIGYLFRNAFVTEAKDVYGIIEKDYYTTSGAVESTETITVESDNFNVFVGNTARHIMEYSGVAAKEMGTVVRAEFYRELADGTFECVLDEYSIASYVKEVMTSQYYGPESTLGKLAIDALCYGAAAQNHFVYNTANLVTDEIADYLSYATQECPEYTSVTDRIDNATKTVRLGRALELASEIAIYSTIQNPDKTAYTGDITALKAKVVYGFEGSEKTAWIDGADFNYIENDGFYYVNVNFLGAAEMDVPVTISVYSGDTLVSDTIKYSVESYANDVFNAYAETHNLHKLMVAILKYGASAKVFLNK